MKGKRFITFPAGGALLLLAALAVAGCGGGSNSNASSGPPKTASGAAATVGVSNEGLGNILVNSKGRTLYLFTRDSGTMSECSGSCAVNWPPLRATGKPTIASQMPIEVVVWPIRTSLPLARATSSPGSQPFAGRGVAVGVGTTGKR